MGNGLRGDNWVTLYFYAILRPIPYQFMPYIWYLRVREAVALQHAVLVVAAVRRRGRRRLLGPLQVELQPRRRRAEPHAAVEAALRVVGVGLLRIPQPAHLVKGRKLGNKSRGDN